MDDAAKGAISFDEMCGQEHAHIAARRAVLYHSTPSAEDVSENLTALCFSGGGVRSASFCLGVARALARAGKLKEFDYLSSVSGGGFAATFITRLVATHCTEKHEDFQGYGSVEKLLASDLSFGGDDDDDLNAADKEDKPKHHPLAELKNRISYLTPRVGLTSLDSLAGAGLVVRNLLLNWLIIVPYLLALALLVKAAFEVLLYWRFLNSTFISFALPIAGLTLMGWTMAESLRYRPGWWDANALPNFPKLFLSTGLPGFSASLLLTLSALKSTEGWKVEGVSDPKVLVAVATGALIMTFAYAQALYRPNARKGTAKDGLANRAQQKGNAPKKIAMRGLSAAWHVGIGAAFIVQGALFAVCVLLFAHFIFANPVIKGNEFDKACLLVGPLLFTSALFLSELIYVALTSGSPKGEVEREWLARSTVAQFRLPLVWLVAGGAIVLAPDLLAGDPNTLSVVNSAPSSKIDATGFWPDFFALLGKLGESTPTAVTTLAGLVTLWLGRAQEAWSLAQKGIETFGQKSRRLILAVALPVFVVGLLVGLGWFAGTFPAVSKENFLNELAILLLSIATWMFVSRFANTSTQLSAAASGFVAVEILVVTTINLWPLVGHALGEKAAGLLVWATVFGSAGAIADYFIECNKFSLHGLYRNRIIRTFMGTANATKRASKTFVDFDESDNLELAAIGKLIPEEMVVGDNNIPPQIIVYNFALNVPASPHLGLQERKALPFTASPFFVGSRAISNSDRANRDRSKANQDGRSRGSYRPSAEYAKLTSLNSSNRALTMGTAAAISGAAFNSNMGYHTSPTLSLLLTAFNMRLGVWLGNPGPSGNTSFRQDGPSFAIRSLATEALGRANEESAFVQLSDGGHFDNLALYDMLARNCALILVVDAGADPGGEMADLGVVNRIAQFDLGVKLNFAPADLKAMRKGELGCMIGDISYSRGEPKSGKLIYLKPMMAEGAPASVASYKALNKQFPHEPTVDQWFSESQFGAYLMLGEHLATEALKDLPTRDHLHQWPERL